MSFVGPKEPLTDRAQFDRRRLVTGPDGCSQLSSVLYTVDWAPYKLHLKVYPENKTLAPTEQEQFMFPGIVPIDWQIVNQAGPTLPIATVDATGLVTAVNTGTCEVQATDNVDQTDNAEITVT